MNGGSRWIGLAMVLVAFLVGGVAGMALDRTLRPAAVQARDADPDRRGGSDRTRGTRGGGPGSFPDRLPILDELDLSEAQVARLDSILEQGRRHVTELWREHEATFRAATDSTRAAVNAVLTPEQRAEYQERVRAFRERRRGGEAGTPRAPGTTPPPERRGPPPPPPGGP